jgi:hypothetical protein
LERSDNPGYAIRNFSNPERVKSAYLTLSALILFVIVVPGLERSDNPGLKLANAFGVFRQSL